MIFRLALFAILLIAAFAAMYFLTRKKWDWNRYAGTVILLFSSLLLIPLAMFAYVSYENRLKIHNSFSGITLAATSADVKFIKGEPNLVSLDITNDENTYENPDEKHEGKIHWRYIDQLNRENYLDIVFHEGKVVEISYTGTCQYCETINKFGIGSYYQDIVKRFGEPAETLISEDELQQRINYPQYQVFFVLQETKVIRHGIYQ